MNKKKIIEELMPTLEDARMRHLNQWELAAAIADALEALGLII